MTGASPFAVRGVIEGFYGNPWTHSQRLAMVDFLASHGMNAFAYAAKDDPLLRRQWRDPYDGDARERLRELADRCRERGVRLVYCVSPGLSIRYSSAADVEALVAKLESVGELGVDAFGVLLDDIPAELQHVEDRAAFADLASAHATLLATVAARLGPTRWLIASPRIYWGRGDEPYLARLAAGLPTTVDLCWTGRAICSPTLDLEDAHRFAATTARPPLYWDNYPVNDVAMSFELHVGPYRGRDRRLAECARGILANPMELAEASRIPLATIADYLADPAGYDPEASWHRAIREVAGEADADAFATFADNCRSSCLGADDDAPVVTEALARFMFRYGEGDGAEGAGELDALADRLLAAADHLLRGPVANPKLVEECLPWIDAFELGALAMRRIAALAAAGRLERDARAELLPSLARLRDARVRVFGDALDMALADLTSTYTRPGHRLRVEQGGGD